MMQSIAPYRSSTGKEEKAIKTKNTPKQKGIPSNFNDFIFG